MGEASFLRDRLLPISTVVLALVALWYVFAVVLNAPFERDTAARAGTTISFTELLPKTMAQERPVLPAPHQVLVELWDTTVNKAITSKRSLVYHSWITLSATLLGFVPRYAVYQLCDGVIGLAVHSELLAARIAVGGWVIIMTALQWGVMRLYIRSSLTLGWMAANLLLFYLAAFAEWWSALDVFLFVNVCVGPLLVWAWKFLKQPEAAKQ